MNLVQEIAKKESNLSGIEEIDIDSMSPSSGDQSSIEIGHLAQKKEEPQQNTDISKKRNSYT